MNNGKVSVYRKKLTFNNPRGSFEGFQEFDFMNVNSTNPIYYFSIAYHGVLSNYVGETLDSKTDKSIRTSIICKTTELVNNSTVDCDYMFINDGGQGQTFIKEPSGEFFWTSSNTASKISRGEKVFKNNKYYCTSDKCTWWGGNNANITRYSFSKNSYGSEIKKYVDYNYGNINSKNIDAFITADWKNDLIAVVVNSKEVKVYDKTKYISGKIDVKKDFIYSFNLPTDDLKTSRQGYGISGGYLYALRGNWNDGMYIEQFNMLGERIGLKNITKLTGFAKYREELQGMSVYDNTIYFGSVHRSNANCVLEQKIKENPYGCEGDNIFADSKYNIYKFK